MIFLRLQQLRQVCRGEIEQMLGKGVAVGELERAEASGVQREMVFARRCIHQLGPKVENSFSSKAGLRTTQRCATVADAPVQVVFGL